MPRDRSPRPGVRSFLSNLFGISRSSSPQPPSRNNGTEHRLTLAAENVSAPPVIHAAPQPSVTTAVSASVAGQDCSVISPSSQKGHLCGTSSINNLPSALHLNQSPSSEITPRLLLSAPPYSEEHHRIHLKPERNSLVPAQETQTLITAPITYQRTPSYPAQSVNHYSIDSLHRDPYDGPSPILPQVANVPQLRTLFEKQCSTSQSPHQSSNEPPPCLHHSSPGMFYQAHDFVIKDSIFVDNSSDDFMASFLGETIPGAEFDSSDPNMPLRCHPGTRLEIIQRCQDFIHNRDGRPKIRWVVGVAGVGKSAIMQSVAHNESNVVSEVIVGATIFFSINRRQDGAKAITTIAYQLAVKLGTYRRFVQQELTDDPSLYRKSLARQFTKLIVEPFIHRHIVDHSSRLLIIIDGLDECANPATQRELLGLVSDFCMTYPTSPIVWMIASRPEPHITSFFAQPHLALSYEKEEILVDSDEAYEDVKGYLRDKFREVQMESITLQELPQWPSEVDFFKIVNASRGLFAYASTVVRYISDPDYGDPVPLLDDVLKIIETGTNENIWGRNHPMAQLDALYSHILSKIPANVMANTRKLLLINSHQNWDFYPFQLQCNMLGMTQNAAYGALHHLRSIASVPGPTEAGVERFEFIHKSFPDYLRDFERSGFSRDIEAEAGRLRSRCVLRVLEEAPDGVYVDGASEHDLEYSMGAFRNGPGGGDNIAVSWPRSGTDSYRELQLTLFHIAAQVVTKEIEREGPFQSLLCIRVATTCFTKLPFGFPYDAVRGLVFDESRRDELLEHGVLKQVPLNSLDYGTRTPRGRVWLRYRGLAVEHCNPWNATCKHERKGSWEGHTSQDWSTDFLYPDPFSPGSSCHYCFERFIHHFNIQSTTERLVTVVDLTPTLRLVELRFVDLNEGGGGGGGGGGSDWTYHFAKGRDEFFHPYERMS